MGKLKVGDKVTVTEPCEAFYSNYGGNPKVIIQPGEIGIVKAISVPMVSENHTFICVDYEKPNVFQGDPVHNNITWRIGIQKEFLKKLPLTNDIPSL